MAHISMASYGMGLVGVIFAAIAYVKLFTLYGIWRYFSRLTPKTTCSAFEFQFRKMSRRAQLRVAIATYLVMKEEEEEAERYNSNKKARRLWVREWIDKRSEVGFTATLYDELKEGDPEMYKNFVRMCAQDFDYLLELVSPIIRKQDTVMRSAITPKERLCVTLRYLATGDSYKSNHILNTSHMQ